MNITLTRILSLIPKKPNGDYVHGAKKKFALSLGYDDGQIISMWENGASKSYLKKIHEIADVYNVNPDWLLGKTDQKEKLTIVSDDELSDGQKRALSLLAAMSPEEFAKKETAIRAILDM